MTAKDLINEIANLKESKHTEILGYNAYAVCHGGMRGVAFETTNQSTVSEKFSNAFLSDANLTLNGRDCHVLYLYTKERLLQEHFGYLCLDFLNLEKREEISADPLAWFNYWKELLGNAQKNKMTYDVLGEMKVLLVLLRRGDNPHWDSLNHSTYDISTPTELYEVKTTKNKLETFVTIHSQFQLNEMEKGKLHIAFVRVEENETGVSIDDLYNDIKGLGYADMDSIDIYLDKQGYRIGKTERKKKYIIHEIRDYLVDDNFPKITENSFINNQIPAGIVKFEYTISLDGLTYTSMGKGDS